MSVTGTPTQLAASVTTLANLGGLPDDAYKDGDFAYVQSSRATYQLDRTSTATPSSVAVDTFSGNGQWVFFQASTSWQTQATWYIDPAAGDDENDGATTTTALATWAEFTRRLEAISLVTTVTILSNIAEPLLGQFRGLNTTATLSIVGNPTILATATGTTFADPVRSGAQSPGTMTAGNIADFTPYLGKILRSPANSYAPVLAISGVAPLLPYWTTEAPVPVQTPPANGTDIEVLDLVTAPTIGIDAVDLPLFVRTLKFTSTDFPSAPWISSTNTRGGYFTACEFTSSLHAPTPIYLIGCYLTGSGAIAPDIIARFMGGGSRNRAIFHSSSSTLSFQGFIVYGGSGVTIGNPGGYGELARISTGGSSLGLGIFAATSNAITIGSMAFASFQSLFGSGNTGYGLVASNGAQVYCVATPTITGGSGDLQVNAAATAIPPLTAAGAVPAASALTTWAQWAAAPFSRNVVSYTNGTRVIGT